MVTGLAMVMMTTLARAQPAEPPLAPPSSSSPSGASFVPPPAAPEPPLLYREADYRWQMMVSDLASVALFTGGTRATVGLGLFSYAFGGPIIHDLNADGGRAGISFGLRIGAPLLGGLALGGLASLTSNCQKDDEDCSSGVGPAALIGVVLGAAVAVLVDDIYVARPRKVYSRGVGLTANVDHGRTSLGLAGSF